MTPQNAFRPLGLNAHIEPAKILKYSTEAGGKQRALDEIMSADGFSSAAPEHKFEIVKRLLGMCFSAILISCRRWLFRTLNRLPFPRP